MSDSLTERYGHPRRYYLLSADLPGGGYAAVEAQLFNYRMVVCRADPWVIDDEW